MWPEMIHKNLVVVKSVAHQTLHLFLNGTIEVLQRVRYDFLLLVLECVLNRLGELLFFGLDPFFLVTYFSDKLLKLFNDCWFQFLDGFDTFLLHEISVDIFNKLL